MGKLTKLTPAHVNEIYRRRALGHQPVAIAELLAEGIVTDDGSELYPVKVGEGAVRHHLNVDGGEQAVQAWRQRLYGDVYLSPLAYAGERMRRLEWLWDIAEGDLEAADRERDRSTLRKEMAGILRAAGELMQQVDPDLTITGTAPGGTRATLSGKADQATLERVAAKLRAAIGAGIIDLDIDQTPDKSTDSGPANEKGRLGKDRLVH